MTESLEDMELQETGGIPTDDHDRETRAGATGSTSERTPFRIIQYQTHAQPELRMEEISSGHSGTSSRRWIHIPVNDIEEAKKFVDQQMGSENYSEEMRKTWDQKLRPLNSVPDDIIPSHAWCMEPSVQVPSGGKIAGITVFFPYLNWETFGKMKQERGKIDPKRTNQQRRTLDEFYYSGLRETASRNAGQTVSKWTGRGVPTNGRAQAAEDSRVILVDQVWIWILDDVTIVSCFPTDLERTQQSSIDIMASVAAGIDNCKDTLDVLALLVSHSVIQMLEGTSQEQADMLAIYRWAAANKAARHTELLEKFWRRQSAPSVEAQETEGSEELNLTLEVVDLLDELNILMLVFEKQSAVVSELQNGLSLIKPKARGKIEGHALRVCFSECTLGDVRLNTSANSAGEIVFSDSLLKRVETVADDVDAASQSLGGYAGERLESAAYRLRLEKSQMERLHREVAETHKLLLELLDLEQKAASLGEARITTKQGQAVMLFTIVTIIFLPLSFFTSYFGQNVSELTGDPQNPNSGDLWKIAAPISVVVILIALAVSFFIIYPWISGKKFVAGICTGIWTSIIQRFRNEGIQRPTRAEDEP